MPPNLIHSRTVASANYYLGKNQKNFQQSMKRIASGKKINGPGNDPGNLAVSMKLNAQLNRISGVQNNIQNSISFLEVQDGALETVGKIMNRMIEHKGLAAQDTVKSAQDLESFDNEFKDLQLQMYSLSQSTFNGVSIFANTNTVPYNNSGRPANWINNQLVFGEDEQGLHRINDPGLNVGGYPHAVSIATSAQSSGGSKVEIHKAALLAALTIQADDPHRQDNTLAQFSQASNTGEYIWAFAAKEYADAWGLNDLDPNIHYQDSPASLGLYEKAMENLSVLRANNSSQQVQLNFAADNLNSYETGLRTAIGRIEDVDIAEESANLAKYSILTQASAAMVAQATSQSQSTMRLLLEM